MRWLLLTLGLIGTLQAALIEATYDVSFSVFGKIGEAKVSLETYDRFYHIKVDAGLTGAAARIGQNRREIHESFGVIRGDLLVPELYKKVRRSNHRHEDTYYVFNLDNTIEKIRFREKKVNGTRFDTTLFKIVDEERIEKSESSETLPYPANNDLLSLFFNVRTLLKTIPRGQEQTEQAVGAKSENGTITITNPAGKKREELAKLMKDHEDRFITVVINQDIFQSDRGELYINLDADLLAKEAMLKDVLLFGDIRGKRVWQKGSLPEFKTSK